MPILAEYKLPLGNKFQVSATAFLKKTFFLHGLVDGPTPAYRSTLR